MFIKYFTQSEELLYFSNDFSVIYSVSTTLLKNVEQDAFIS